MKNIVLSAFLFFTLLTSLHAQQSISVKLHYPTPGQSDGSIKLKVYGYPNPVEFKLDGANIITAPNAIMGSVDSVVNLNFTEVLVSVNCIDLITQDTVSAVAVNLSHNWLDSITINTVSPNNWGSCDGSINADIVFQSTYIDNNLSIAIDATPDNGVQDTIPSPTQSWADLCQGKYMLHMNSIGNNGLLLMAGFKIFPLNFNNIPNFQIELNTFPSIANCDGEAEANVIGGTNPYLYSYDQGIYDTDPGEIQLCPGVHTLHVIDNAQDTLGINFGIADASNYYQDPFISGTVDSVYFNTQNCQFDYNTPVDSMFITSFLEIDQTTSLMTVEVWQTGVSTEYTDTIFATYSLSGSNLISITYFCGAQKAGNLVYQMVTQASVTGVAGLNSLESDGKGVEIYPNPANDYLSVSSSDKIDNLLLMDMNGSTIRTSDYEKMDLKLVPAGVYLLKITNEKGESTIKRVVVMF